jgi:hypothetical protein
MSLSAAIAVVVILDLTLLGFLAWMMSHARRLAPHVLPHERAAAEQRIFIESDRPDAILERVT